MCIPLKVEYPSSCGNEKNILLVVILSTQQFESSHAYRAAIEADPQGKRTIFIFSKFDFLTQRMDPFKNMKSLQNQMKNALGIVAVSNFDVSGQKIDSFTKETEFFKNNFGIGSDTEIDFGFQKILDILFLEQSKKLENASMHLQRLVLVETKTIQQDLSELPKLYESPDEKNKYITHVLEKITKHLKQKVYNEENRKHVLHDNFSVHFVKFDRTCYVKKQRTRVFKKENLEKLVIDKSEESFLNRLNVLIDDVSTSLQTCFDTVVAVESELEIYSNFRMELRNSLREFLISMKDEATKECEQIFNTEAKKKISDGYQLFETRSAQFKIAFERCSKFVEDLLLHQFNERFARFVLRKFSVPNILEGLFEESRVVSDKRNALHRSFEILLNAEKELKQFRAEIV